jgi:hypothetical protein
MLIKDHAPMVLSRSPVLVLQGRPTKTLLGSSCNSVTDTWEAGQNTWRGKILYVSVSEERLMITSPPQSVCLSRLSE